MVKGAVILSVAQINPAVAAHVGNNIYQSVKSTAKDVKTIAGTAAQIAYSHATGQPAKVDEAKFNAAAQRQAKSIVKTGVSAVLATGIGLAAQEAAQLASNVKIPTKSLSTFEDVALSSEEAAAIKGGGYNRQTRIETFTQGTSNNKVQMIVEVPEGFELVKVEGAKADVFKQKGKNVWISPDLDGHNGGVWKKATGKAENLFKKDTREGTYNGDLTKKIGE